MSNFHPNLTPTLEHFVESSTTVPNIQVESTARTDPPPPIVLNTADVAEVSRATAAEGTLTTNLDAEIVRAKGAEGTLTTNLNAEIARATLAEGYPSVSGIRSLWVHAGYGVVSSGDRVSQWIDQSGNSNNFAMATVSRQPTWIANGINGRPSLQMVASASQVI